MREELEGDSLVWEQDLKPEEQWIKYNYRENWKYTIPDYLHEAWSMLINSIKEDIREEAIEYVAERGYN